MDLPPHSPHHPSTTIHTQSDATSSTSFVSLYGPCQHVAPLLNRPEDVNERMGVANKAKRQKHAPIHTIRTGLDSSSILKPPQKLDGPSWYEVSRLTRKTLTLESLSEETRLRIWAYLDINSIIVLIRVFPWFSQEFNLNTEKILEKIF
jgi:hypothetical protein